ncbi:MAG: four helix bundle protein [Methanobacteriota archaeon]
MNPRNLHDLRVWVEATGLADRVYDATATWPTDERLGLVAQARRAAVSIAVHIAEGESASADGDERGVGDRAQASGRELYTLMQIARLRAYGNPEETQRLQDETVRLLVRLHNLLQSRQSIRA